MTSEYKKGSLNVTFTFNNNRVITNIVTFIPDDNTGTPDDNTGTVKLNDGIE